MNANTPLRPHFPCCEPAALAAQREAGAAGGDEH